MRRLCLTGMLLLVSGSAWASEVYRWVDANGVTQFSDARQAPAQADPVRIQATNGMDVPDASSISRSKSRPGFRKISRAAKKNKDGWRGHYSSIKRHGRSSYRR